jgi:hypothetical protein
VNKMAHTYRWPQQGMMRMKRCSISASIHIHNIHTYRWPLKRSTPMGKSPCSSTSSTCSMSSNSGNQSSISSTCSSSKLGSRQNAETLARTGSPVISTDIPAALSSAFTAHAHMQYPTVCSCMYVCSVPFPAQERRCSYAISCAICMYMSMYAYRFSHL